MDDKTRKTIDQELITRVVFHPTRIPESSVPPGEHGRILRIPAGGDELGAYWHEPRADAATVLFFHGNGEVMTDYLHGYHREIEEMGLNFLVVDYRGYGLSSGSPTLSRLIEDCRAAWDHLTSELGLAPSEVIVMGRSLGSLAALELAGGPARDAKGLVIESGIGSFHGWIERMESLLVRLKADTVALKASLREVFDQKAKIERFNGPALVMHAPDDEIVPVRHGRDLASWGDPDRTELHVFERGGHNDIHYVNRDEYFRVLSDFTSRL